MKKGRLRHIINERKKFKARIKAMKSKKSCEWCGTKRNLTADHIKPLSAKGKSIKSNIRILCWFCHSKRNKGEYS